MKRREEGQRGLMSSAYQARRPARPPTTPEPITREHLLSSEWGRRMKRREDA